LYGRRFDMDAFDRLIGAIHGLPDILATKPTTIREVSPLIGETMTFIVQTYRQKDKGDIVFIEVASGAQHTRLVLPAKVADVIVRQRDALTTKARRKQGRERAEADKAAGILPGFLRAK
jgi:hypothetical protein